MSDQEIFARLSTMKSFLMKKGILKKGEDINKYHIEKLRKYTFTLSEEEYIKFIEIGFLQYLPMIKTYKMGDMNLIVQNKKSNVNITLT